MPSDKTPPMPPNNKWKDLPRLPPVKGGWWFPPGHIYPEYRRPGPLSEDEQAIGQIERAPRAGTTIGTQTGPYQPNEPGGSPETNADRENRATGFRPADRPAPTDRIVRMDARAAFLRWIEKNGIPVDNQTVQSWLSTNLYVDFFEKDAQGYATNTLSADGQEALGLLLSQKPQAATPYADFRAEMGFDPQGGPEQQDREQEGARYRYQQPSFDPSGGIASTTNPDTQGKLYANGVVVGTSSTTGTKSVLYPNDPNVAGSGPWMDGVNNWSPSRVIAEKKRLQAAGWYTPPGDQVDGKVTGEFLQALQGYHDAKYIFGNGKPVDSDQGSAAGGARETQDLRQLSAQIRNSVREQYITVYGAEPTDEELATWTNFIIAQGNKMQKGGQGLSPSDALAESTAQMVEETATDPEAIKLAKYTNENTGLRDAIDSAARMTKQAFF